MTGAPSILGALITSVAVCMVLGYAWRQTREGWLGWLLLVWLLWVARYGAAISSDTLWPIGNWALGSLSPAPAFLLRDAALVLMLRALGERWALPVWGASVAPLLGAAGAAVVSGEPAAAWVDDYLFVTHALLWLYAALILARTPRLRGPLRLLAPAGLVVHAVVVGTSPWVGDGAFTASISYGVSTLVHLLFALGIGTGVRERMLDEHEGARRRASRALEFVVRGMVPMCAYCRSVRDGEGRWTTLEAFVGQQTAAPVSEVRCPSCAAGLSALRAPLTT